MESKNRNRIIFAAFAAVSLLSAVVFALLVEGGSSNVSPPASETSSDGELPPFAIILIVGFIALSNLISFGVLYLRLRRSPLYKDALENGRAGIATITAVKATGVRYRWAGQPRMYQYALTATVDPPNGPPYEAKLVEYFPRELIPNPSDTFHVRIHVDRPEIVAIVHRDPRHPESKRHTLS